MKFRRKANEVESDAGDAVVEHTEPQDSPTAGPYDISEVDVENDGVERVDLGGLLLAPAEGRDVRLQVEEETGEVQSVLIAGEDGALELKAFAAPRNGNLWAEVMPQIAADMSQRGGTATQRDGRFGNELVCMMPVQRPDGTAATQPSRIVGINGDRWMLRATFLGEPALSPDSSQDWEDTLATVVVRRGEQAMPVGDAIEIKLPPQARRAE